MPLKIFFTTDNHVGYNELDPVRGDDASNTFAEAMQIARAENSDLILQGGDLFHINKPSKRSMYQVLKILRQTCLGDKPVEFEVLNHGDLTLRDAEEFNHLNFEDPNFNIAVPFFAISGNHDDAGGSASNDNMLSPLDLLAMGGLINHFGRVPDNTKIVVKPILIDKYGIKCAIYGMANVRDERLYRTFLSGGVHFLRPREEPDQYYNILMVHQNHTPFGPKNYLPEQFLPEFIDLVLWGHEHECKIDPTLNETKQFYVVQPGSSVATSLSTSELGSKYAFSVSIDLEKKATFQKHLLKTVRPFVMRTVCLSTDAPSSVKPMKSDTRAKVTEFLIGQVEEMLEEAKSQWIENHSAEEPQMLPLVRLRVDYSGGYELENITRFSNRFVGRVANSNDVLHLIKRRNRLTGEADIALDRATTEVNNLSNEEAQETTSKLVPLLLRQELNIEELEILLPKGMVDALQRYVEKDEKQAIKSKVDDLVQTYLQRLDISNAINLQSVGASNELFHAPAKRGTSATPPDSKKRTTVKRAADKNGAETNPNKRSTESNQTNTRSTATSFVEESDEDQPTPSIVPAKPVRSNRATMEKSDIPLFVDFDDDSSDAMFSPSD